MPNKSKLIRAAEWLDALPGVVKGWPWGQIAVIIVAICILIWVIIFTISRADSDSQLIDSMQKQILDDVAQDREEMDRKIGELQAELFEYREQLKTLKEEIRISAEERDKDHEDIDNATSISDVNNVLRKGKSPTRTVNAVLKRPPPIEKDSRGMASNPY